MPLIKVAIIGFGSIGEKHFKILKKIKSVKKIIIISKRKIYTKSKFKTIIVNNDINFLKNEKPDIVFICSPASIHLSQLWFIAKLGINIFVEKPLTNYEKIDDNFLNLLKKKHIYFFVGYVFKYKKIFINLKKIIDKEIKKKNNPFLINSICTSNVKKWRNRDYRKSVSVNKKFGGGVINELSHELYYLNLMVKNLTLKKTVKINNLEGTDVESLALIQMEDNINKTFCNIYLNYNSTYEERKCEIFFKTKKIIADFNSNTISILNKNNIKKVIILEKKNMMYENQILEILKTIKFKKNLNQNHNQFKFYNKINNLLIETNK